MEKGYKTKINQQKKDAVEELKTLFKDSNDYIFTNYRGLSVTQITELRRKLREKNADYKVVKNRFAKLAFRQMESPDISPYFTGPTAVALSKEDTPQVAKELINFGKEAPVTIKGGLVDGTVFDEQQMEELSKLPSKDELIAKLMATMQAPLQNLVYVINGVPQKLVRTLQAVADKKKEQE